MAALPLATRLRVIGELEVDERDISDIRAAADALDAAYAALKEIQTICTESAGHCRKRMGTRVGNTLVAAGAALAKMEPRS